MSEVLKNLNSRQLRVAEHQYGPLMVVAIPGAGKTRSIVARTVKLIKKGVDPSKILSITFTNKAAEELKIRIAKLVGTKVTACTFHSYCYKLLKNKGNFSIATDSDSERLVKDVCRSQKIEADKFGDMHSRIMYIKDTGTSPKNELEEKILKLYNEKLYNAHTLDFADLLIYGEKILQKEKQPFEYIQVDEYQDVNQRQFNIARLLAHNDNLCVVGDSDQAIYSFRGSDSSYLLKFSEFYPNCETIKLEQNYRSAQKILDFSANVISNNTIRDQKELNSNISGKSPILLKSRTDLDEADLVIEKISDFKRNGKSYEDIAILVRTGWASSTIERKLREVRIPHRVVGSYSFYERSEIRDALGMLRYAYNRKDYLAFERISVSLPKIGKKTAEAGFEKHNKKLDWVYTSADKLVEYKEKTRNAIKDIWDEIDFKKVLKEKYPEDYPERLKNFDQLIGMFVESNMTMEENLGFIALTAKSDEWDETDEALSVVTCHAAKGKEWDTVFVVGCDENLFPHSLAIAGGEVEEERRLFYVACTRAKNNLFLTTSETRYMWGTYNEMNPSRFLSEGFKA